MSNSGMQTDQNINVIIGGRPYYLKVERNEEELVRNAAERINETIKEYSETFNYKDQQDLFAMTALQHVANSMRLEKEKSFKDNEMGKKLSAIDELLSKHVDQE